MLPPGFGGSVSESANGARPKSCLAPRSESTCSAIAFAASTSVPSNGFLPALSRMSMKPTRRPREKSGATSMRSLPWRKSISEKRMSVPSPLTKKGLRLTTRRSTRSSFALTDFRSAGLYW